jgi:hypothetical protein
VTARLHSRGARCAVLLSTLAVTAGCALGPQQEPVALSSTPGNGRPSRQQTGAATVKVSERVYLVHNGSLVQVRRSTPLRNTHLQTVIGALFEPLRFTERNEGLRTALPRVDKPVAVHVSDHLASLQLPPGFDGLAVSEQILAVGQLVFTISANSAAFRVEFTDGKKEIPVPDGGGRLVDHPVTRADYVRIAPVRL